MACCSFCITGCLSVCCIPCGACLTICPGTSNNKERITILLGTIFLSTLLIAITSGCLLLGQKLDCALWKNPPPARLWSDLNRIGKYSAITAFAFFILFSFSCCCGGASASAAVERGMAEARRRGRNRGGAAAVPLYREVYARQVIAQAADQAFPQGQGYGGDLDYLQQAELEFLQSVLVPGSRNVEEAERAMEAARLRRNQERSQFAQPAMPDGGEEDESEVVCASQTFTAPPGGLVDDAGPLAELEDAGDDSEAENIGGPEEDS